MSGEVAATRSRRPADFFTGLLEPFFEQKTSIENGAAPVCDARRLNAVDTLAAFDGVDVECGMARELRHDRNVGEALAQPRHELAVKRVDDSRHMLDGADAEKGHAAMRDASVRGDFEPIDAPMSDADAIDVQRFRDDHVVGARGSNPLLLTEERHAGEPAAFLVDRAADFNAAVQAHACAANRFCGVYRSGDSGLHIAGAASVNAAAPDYAAKRIDGPSVAGRHDIEMSVEVHEGSRLRAGAEPYDVDSRVTARVFRAIESRDVLDVELELRKPFADEPGARFVRFARRIDRRYPDEILRELDDLACRSIDFGEHAIDHGA